MFTTTSRPCRLSPIVWALGILASEFGVMFCIQVRKPKPQALTMNAPFEDKLHVIPLWKPPKLVSVTARSRREKPAAAAKAAEKNRQSQTPSAIPGTPEWRRHVERGHDLDFEIVAEQSLPVLRAFGVPLAMEVHRPRGKTLLYNLQNGSLNNGTVDNDAVVREIEGLPSEFDGPLQEAARQLGARPRVWALYSGALYSALRSLTEDALKQQGVPIDSVKAVRVRLSVVGGRAFAVKLLAHS